MPAGALESPSIPTLRPPAGERAHRMADFGTDEVVLKSLIDTANKPDALPLMAIASWINAFTAFKMLRQIMGVPTGDGILVYGSMLAGLKSGGKALLLQIDKEQIDLSLLGMDRRNFLACLEEIKEDDLILDLGLLEKEDAEISALFEPKQAIAPA
jgi:hypothetical protein